MFRGGFTKANLGEPWKPLLLSKIIQKGGSKLQCSALWIMPVFSPGIVVSCTTSSGSRDQDHSFLPVLNECLITRSQCWHLPHWLNFWSRDSYCLGFILTVLWQEGWIVTLTYCCICLLGKFETCQLEESLKCIFHFLGEWPNYTAILKNVESSTNAISSPPVLVSKADVID